MTTQQWAGARGLGALTAIIKNMSLTLSTVGNLWMVLSRGVTWSDLGSKKKLYYGECIEGEHKDPPGSGPSKW